MSDFCRYYVEGESLDRAQTAVQDGEKKLTPSQYPFSLLPNLPVWFDFQTAAAHRPHSLGAGEGWGRARGKAIPRGGAGAGRVFLGIAP